jgi:hypothetical protein
LTAGSFFYGHLKKEHSLAKTNYSFEKRKKELAKKKKKEEKQQQKLERKEKSDKAGEEILIQTE